MRDCNQNCYDRLLYLGFALIRNIFPLCVSCRVYPSHFVAWVRVLTEAFSV